VSTEHHTTELAKMISLVFKMKSAKAEPEVMEVWHSMLSEFDITYVRKALNTYIRTKTFTADVAEVLALLNKPLFMPALEAFGQECPRRESDFAWLNQVSGPAWGAALPFLDDGDIVGARQTYVETYNRALAELPPGEKPKYWITEGSGASHAQRLEKKTEMYAQHPERRPLARLANLKQLTAEGSDAHAEQGLIGMLEPVKNALARMEQNVGKEMGLLELGAGPTQRH